jgi:hypothetical protein
MAEYIDLFITDNDLTLDAGNEPALIADRDSITQDIKHLIRDSSLLSACIGERDRANIAALMQQLELMIEDDERLIPGTVEITRTDTETFFITATTEQFGVIQFEAFA